MQANGCMSKLDIGQKIIFELMIDAKLDFFVAGCWRPYACSEKQQQSLWDVFFKFSFSQYQLSRF